MGLNFPSSPTDGQVFGDYVYNSVKGVWLVSEVTVPTVTTDDNPPSSPKDGDMWMYTGDGTVFVFYQDIDGGQWVQTGGGAVEPKTDNLPAGSVIMWAAAVAPSNWLLCDGAVVERSVWPSLFANIGTTYNTGGETTEQFRLPNLKGRVAVGLDSSQTEFDTLGETGGAKTHTLTTAQMPSHTHIQNSHTHIQDAHNHALNGWVFNGANPGAIGARYGIAFQFNTGGTFSNTGNVGGEVPWYNNATTATNQATTATNQNTGGGEAHNNLQPYIVLNYIIKATAGVTVGDTELETRVGELESSSDDPIKLNGQTIYNNYSIPVGYNGLSAGPITIASGVTVTIPDGSAWSVV
jgi:microcystin-dependent protein